MLYAGLDLSRKRLDFHLLDSDGRTVDVGAAPPDIDGLHGLSERLARHGAPIRAAIESMNGARFVHDRLELAGWQVEIADAQKVKGLAPLACKTDRIDAWVLAERLPDPRVRAERERARCRLHLVRHRSSALLGRRGDRAPHPRAGAGDRRRGGIEAVSAVCDVLKVASRQNVREVLDRLGVSPRRVHATGSPSGDENGNWHVCRGGSLPGRSKPSAPGARSKGQGFSGPQTCACENGDEGSRLRCVLRLAGAC
jgi:hypothetical protein